MRVRAIAVGFHEKLREPGTPDDTFEVPEGSKASWYVPADEGEPGKGGGAGKAPQNQGKPTVRQNQGKPTAESAQTAQGSSTDQSQAASATGSAKL